MFRIQLRRDVSLATLAFLGLSTSISAQTAPSSGIRWIDWMSEQVAFALEEAAPPEGVPQAPAATHSIESVEISRLREEIRLLRDLIEQGVVGRVIALEGEVRALRGDLQQAQIAGYGGIQSVTQPNSSLSAVPMPPGFTNRSPEPMAAEVLREAVPPAPFEFTVVDEWGRSPEVVAELGNDASTLIGIAGVVPPRSAQKDVEALLRDLRAEYEAYDNINIEIFDTEAAAEAFATQQDIDSAHHIASISRYKASNRDVMVYLGDGKLSPVLLPSE
mgnify:CR=1 FL=1|tara:strand:+ start:2190 stop:3014 length:825 start_codon:yes stop_codon:yes gene_type:complete